MLTAGWPVTETAAACLAYWAPRCRPTLPALYFFFGREICLVGLPFPVFQIPAVHVSDGVRVSSTERHHPLLLWNEHILAVSEQHLALRQHCVLKQPKYVSHCSFFCSRQLQQSPVCSRGCIASQLANKRINNPTIAPQASMEICTGAIIFHVEKNPPNT